MLCDLATVAEVQATIEGPNPWCMRLNAVLTEASPTVGDREHELYYSPKVTRPASHPQK